MRHVPLNESAIQALCRLREMYSDSPFVCGGWKTPREWFSLAVQRAEVKNFTWHCLRHTYASRLVMAGVDLRTAAELLGHKTLAMVMRYAHLAPDYERAAVERMDLIFTERTDTRTDTGTLASSAVVH